MRNSQSFQAISAVSDLNFLISMGFISRRFQRHSPRRTRRDQRLSSQWQCQSRQDMSGRRSLPPQGWSGVTGPPSARAGTSACPWRAADRASLHTSPQPRLCGPTRKGLVSGGEEGGKGVRAMKGTQKGGQEERSYGKYGRGVRAIKGRQKRREEDDGENIEERE